MKFTTVYILCNFRSDYSLRITDPIAAVEIQMRLFNFVKKFTQKEKKC